MTFSVLICDSLRYITDYIVIFRCSWYLDWSPSCGLWKGPGQNFCQVGVEIWTGQVPDNLALPKSPAGKVGVSLVQHSQGLHSVLGVWVPRIRPIVAKLLEAKGSHKSSKLWNVETFCLPLLASCPLWPLETSSWQFWRRGELEFCRRALFLARGRGHDCWGPWRPLDSSGAKTWLTCKHHNRQVT